MYLGAHGEANALDTVLEAAHMIRDRNCHEIKFVLVGDGPEKPRLIELAKELGLKNVEFRDPIEKTQVPKVLSKADAVIFNLEKAEVFKYGISSNKLFDYMAAGKPVIFSVKASNNPVEEAHCGFTVQARDPQALAEAVINLYQMPIEEREALGHQGRKYVELHHAIPVLAERMIQCIERTLQ
jgi:glycosyltransferase involved in cell wall biosynthesis